MICYWASDQWPVTSDQWPVTSDQWPVSYYIVKYWIVWFNYSFFKHNFLIKKEDSSQTSNMTTAVNMVSSLHQPWNEISLSSNMIQMNIKLRHNLRNVLLTRMIELILKTGGSFHCSSQHVVLSECELLLCQILNSLNEFIICSNN